MTEAVGAKRKLAPLIAVVVVAALVVAAAIWHFMPIKSSAAQTLFKSGSPNIVSIEKMSDSSEMQVLAVDSACEGYADFVAALEQEQVTFKKDEVGIEFKGVVYTVQVESGSESVSVTFGPSKEAHSNTDERTYELDSLTIYEKCEALYAAAEQNNA